MRRPRFQFSLSTLLWIMVAVTCWCGGRVTEKYLERTRLKAALSSANEEIQRISGGMLIYPTPEYWAALDERKRLAKELAVLSGD